MEDYITIEEKYDEEGKRIVTVFKKGEVLERTYYGVEIPTEYDIISTWDLFGGIFMMANEGKIQEIETKEKKLVRKSLEYQESLEYQKEDNFIDIYLGMGNLVQEGVAGQLLNNSLEIAKAPNTSYRVYWDEKKKKKITEVYLEFVKEAKGNLLNIKKISMAQIMQMGELLFMDMIIGNQDRFINVFNTSNILIDINGNLNAIDTTFSTLCLYMIWIYNNELERITDIKFYKNNIDNFELTNENIENLVEKIKKNIRNFITSYKQQEENDTVFKIMRETYLIYLVHLEKQKKNLRQHYMQV